MDSKVLRIALNSNLNAHSFSRATNSSAPQVYTVGSQGSVYIPEGSSVSHQHQSNVRQDNVIVPGAVPILNSEEALRKSNKLFDLVSGYGTFLPAKEEEHVEKSSSSSSSIKSGSQYGSQSQYSVRGEHESSAEYLSRVTGSGGEYHRVSGVTYQPSASSGSGTGYQGVIPAGGGVKKTTTVYSSYSSNQGLGSQISPGVPVGDTINPPEVSGSYFSAGGAGGRQGYTTRTGYATSGGYGVRNENYGYSGASRDAALSSGYGVKSSGLSSSYAANANTLASGYAANANRDAAITSGYAARDAALTQNLALNRDYTAVCPTVCPVIEPNCILPVCDTSTGGVKKYGISSSWSSKSQTVNGKTTESKQAQVTVNDNGKIDTYSTHNRK
ncbi:probable ATP-dependent RNA helicase ddx17 [Diaphorina citri]|uniref:Probable ATP-dependent RNA helicase ddx17 n=1 Tax=Diaphorina citri TaxID=121845 RepID=A0A3Q0JCT4_DIACI|nr:probable ATP-dependent RNA helicase ddx17 [Diaphorina citri]